MEGGGGAQQQSVDSQSGCCVGWEGWSTSVAVATVGVGRDGRGRRARGRDGGNRPRGHGGLPSTTLFGGNRRVDGPWRVGFLVLLGSWCRAGRERASRAGQGTAEIDRGGVVECPSPLCLHFPP